MMHMHASAKVINARNRQLAVVMNAFKPIVPSDFKRPGEYNFFPAHHGQRMYQMRRLDFCGCNQINEEDCRICRSVLDCP
jgi:hypothetical protein